MVNRFVSIDATATINAAILLRWSMQMHCVDELPLEGFDNNE
jgi:hypothetical protein